jgi:hypothetical protein
MIVELTKNDLIRLVCSTFPNNYDELTRQGKVIFVGNQYSEVFQWNTNYLKGLSEEQLFKLYTQYKQDNTCEP